MEHAIDPRALCTHAVHTAATEQSTRVKRTTKAKGFFDKRTENTVDICLAHFWVIVQGAVIIHISLAGYGSSVRRELLPTVVLQLMGVPPEESYYPH